jgi:hypothetical protein
LQSYTQLHTNEITKFEPHLFLFPSAVQKFHCKNPDTHQFTADCLQNINVSTHKHQPDNIAGGNKPFLFWTLWLVYIYIYNIWNVYTGCNRRNGPDFGRGFFMLKYTDITQNTYVQSWTVTEIMAREICDFLATPRTVPVADSLLGWEGTYTKNGKDT